MLVNGNKLVVFISLDGVVRERLPIKTPQPLPGAIDSCNRLMDEPFIETFFVTNRGMSYAKDLEWLCYRMTLNNPRGLIVTPDSGVLFGDILIDDWEQPTNQGLFRGEVIHYGYGETKGWPETMDRILEIHRQNFGSPV